ncbi:MAG: hypothetical protein H9W80_12865 [Enterococcus sp.]|nr:hypothetical protein [Enterococcus sp.]
MMIEKKPGKINEIIYNHTIYFGGEKMIFPTLDSLSLLIDNLIKAKATTEYVYINPFYRNTKSKYQIEFDQLLFFLECKDSVTEEEELAAVLDTLDENPLMDLPTGKALRPMCRFDDPEKFGRALEIYRDYLDTAIPEMLAFAKEELKLQEEELGFGYFSFEIFSG